MMTTNNRPLSPHLQVYQPQLTSVLSILHRGTGVALAIGSLLLVYWLAAASSGPDAYATAESFFGNWFIQLLLFGWTFALFYHLCNGVRHLSWDLGFGFEMDTVYKSGKAVVVAAGVLTVFTWIVA
jgi:succinate dehydrogenase / fumarate reductase cytochrome b subunit